MRIDHLLCNAVILCSTDYLSQTFLTHTQTHTHTQTLTYMHTCIQIDFLLWSRSSTAQQILQLITNHLSKQLVRFTLIMLDRLSQLAVDDIFYNTQSAHTVDSSEIYSVMFSVWLCATPTQTQTQTFGLTHIQYLHISKSKKVGRKSLNFWPLVKIWTDKIFQILRKFFVSPLALNFRELFVHLFIPPL